MNQNRQFRERDQPFQNLYSRDASELKEARLTIARDEEAIEALENGVRNLRKTERELRESRDREAARLEDQLESEKERSETLNGTELASEMQGVIVLLWNGRNEIGSDHSKVEAALERIKMDMEEDARQRESLRTKVQLFLELLDGYADVDLGQIKAFETDTLKQN